MATKRDLKLREDAYQEKLAAQFAEILARVKKIEKRVKSLTV